MLKRHRMLVAGGSAFLVLLAVTLVALFGDVTPARAQIDISGEWNFEVFGFGPVAVPCATTIEQTDTTFTIETECTNVGPGSFTGTIDIETGEFTASGSIAGIPIELAGTASPDGQTIEGTWNASVIGFSGTLTAERSGPVQSPTPLPTLPAPVDLTGTWQIAFSGIFSGSCDSVIEQSGTELLSRAQCSILGSISLTGTIDQTTGMFELSGIVTLEGVVAADGNSFTGSWAALGFGGNLTGERVNDIELVDISGDWDAVLLGEVSDTCALEIDQGLIVASAVLDCEELGAGSLEGAINPFSGSFSLRGTLGEVEQILSGQLSADGSYIFGRELVNPSLLPDSTSTSRTFIAVPAGVLERGIVLLNCRPEAEVVSNNCSYGAGVGVNEFLIEVQVAVAPVGGYGGLDATVTWPDSLEFQRSSSECQSGVADVAERSFSVSCVFGTHGDLVGGVIALTMTCAANGGGGAFNLVDTSFQDLEEALGPPTLINATIMCFAPQRSGPSFLIGDADCSSEMNSIDAALVLQFEAGLLESLPCEFQADVNADGTIDSRDALLILQTTAGLL